MEYYANIYDYIKGQEAAFKLPIRLNDSWKWNFPEHVRTSSLYKHSQLVNGKEDFTPVKNITRPILNLQYRAEGFDVKDIVLYVDSKGKYHLSFLAKKFHEKWARENAIDTFIDQLVESYVDYGGALVKNVKGARPEVVPLQSIVFCDQTDLLSGPIGIKHFFSPDQLLAMESAGWGETKNGATVSLKDVIRLSRTEKKSAQDHDITDTPGKYIEVYEIHGQLPKMFLDPTASAEDYENQLQIVCFYQAQGKPQGITLYRAKEKKLPFKMIKRDEVFGRALGFGGAEELFEAQVWTNYNAIREQHMLDAASKTLLGVKGTQSAAIVNRNNVKDLDNLSTIDLGIDGEMAQIDTYPRNMALFEKSDNEWMAHAQQMGAANDSIMGKSPTAGTPFKLQELVTAESHSLHEYRKGKLATFIDEIYREWVIPHIARELAKGSEFLADLDLDELQYVMECTVRNEAHNFIKEKILEGELVEPEEVEQLKETTKEDFKARGTKHPIKIFESEMKDIPVSVKTNIAGKQKDLAETVDKIGNVIRTVLQAGGPTALSFPATWDLINQMIEKSGLDPVDFSGLADAFKKMQAQEQAMAMQPQQPMQPVQPTV